MNFGNALKKLYEGEKIRNEAWGKGVFISVDSEEILRLVKTDSNEVTRSWLPTQQDIFSEKWKKVSAKVKQTTLDTEEEEVKE